MSTKYRIVVIDSRDGDVMRTVFEGSLVEIEEKYPRFTGNEVVNLPPIDGLFDYGFTRFESGKDWFVCADPRRIRPSAPYLERPFVDIH